MTSEGTGCIPCQVEQSEKMLTSEGTNVVTCQVPDAVHNVQEYKPRSLEYRKQYCFGFTKVPIKPVATRAKILIDSGNLTQHGVVMSEEYRRRAKIGFSRIGGRKVGTAGKGLGMTQTGVSQPFDMRIQGINKTFRVKAMVIKDLSDDINLGASFLQKHQITLKFSQEGTTLMVDDSKLELVKKVNNVEPDSKGNTVKPDRLKRGLDEGAEDQRDRKSGSPGIQVVNQNQQGGPGQSLLVRETRDIQSIMWKKWSLSQ